jgi:formate C-acetyltransferase
MLNSIRQLPRDGLASGALNLDVDKRQFAGEAGRELFCALLGTYFNGGGLHAQISSLDKDDLLDAKIDPEAHRDLTVRITGYSGVFVDVCERLQNDIIERFN